MDITKDILSLYPKENKLALADPMNDLMIRAFAVAPRHTEEAFLTLHMQLLTLAHKHVPLAQAGVFLAATFQVMCTYHQEIDNMMLSQTIMPAQVMPKIWGVQQGIIEGLSLLGLLTCPASWPASLIERVNEEPTKRAIPVPPTTPSKSDKGKLFPGSSAKKLSQPKQISDYWKDTGRQREDEESQKQEEEAPYQVQQHSNPFSAWTWGARFHSDIQSCSKLGISTSRLPLLVCR